MIIVTISTLHGLYQLKTMEEVQSLRFNSPDGFVRFTRGTHHLSIPIYQIRYIHWEELKEVNDGSEGTNPNHR